MAKKYIENFIKRLENIDSTVIRQQGNIYKKAYSSVIKRSKETLSPLFFNLFHGKIINYEIFINNMDTLYDTICSNMSQFIEKHYTIQINGFCNNLMDNLNITQNGNINSVELYKWHPFINRTINLNLFNGAINPNIFNSIIDELNTIAIKYENILKEQINNERLQLNPISNSLNFINLINNQEHLTIKTFIQHLLNMYRIIKYKFKKNMLAKHLNLLKATLLNTTIKPSNIEKNKAIKDSANKFYPICGNVNL
jgi:formate dehydrogenase maturation protein FdhE